MEQIDYLKKNYSKNIKGKAPWTWSDCFWVKTGIYMTVEGNLKVCALNTDTDLPTNSGTYTTATTLADSSTNGHTQKAFSLFFSLSTNLFSKSFFI